MLAYTPLHGWKRGAQMVMVKCRMKWWGTNLGKRALKGIVENPASRAAIEAE
jgi:hypothetical protein